MSPIADFRLKIEDRRLTWWAVLALACWVAAFALPAVAADELRTTAAAIDVEAVVLRLLSEAEVPAQEVGVITRLGVREGQRVKHGELLAQVDDQVARMAQRAAELAYEAAKAKATNDVKLRYAAKALEVSEAELRRSTESIERFAGSVSESQIDVERLTVQKNRLETEQAEHDLAVARLEMQAKENELSAARLEVERRQITAPIDGVVVQVFVHQGEWVEPGQKALRIVNIDRLKAEGFVSATQATATPAGTPVRLTVDLGGGADTSCPGTVAFVSPEVDPITGQVRIWAEIDNRDGRLRPGQAARMTARTE